MHHEEQVAERVDPATGWMRLKRLLPSIRLSQKHWTFLKRAIIMAIAARIGILVMAYITGYAIVGIEGAPAKDVIHEMLNRWDAPHYQQIADTGYQSEGPDSVHIVFFPLYPLLIRIVAFFLSSFFVSAMFVSAIASVAAGFFIQAIISREGGDDAEAQRGLWYLTLFPTAYFFVAPYTEALFVALIVASMLAARNGYWGWAGFLGMLATATRIQGLALLPALAVEAFHQEKWKAPLRAYGLLLAPLGFISYLGINWHVMGDPFTFMDVQRDHWSQDTAMPWNVLRSTIQAILDDAPGSFRTQIYEFRLASAVVAAVLLVIGARFLRPSYQVYAWVGLIFMLSATFQISMPRYLLGFFPIFMVLAYVSRSPAVHQTLLVVSAILLGGLFIMYATRFGF